MKYRLGIDVGGTNTDAVILDLSNQPIAKAKTPTTEDVTSGILKALDAVIEAAGISPAEISHAMLGTTHCTNAIVERSRLSPIGVIRLGAPATLAIKPLTAWPADLRSQLGKHSYVVEGGHEFDGSEIASLNENELRRIARELKGFVKAIAVAGVFSPVNPSHEVRAGEILREELGNDFSISLSHEIGALGLLERENATILNAAVVDVAKKASEAFRSALQSRGVRARMYFTQNDGTLMALDYAIRYPIRTVASGPANSIRGAAYLSGLSDALVVDVGGTTSDIGVLAKGFPRESAVAVEIGGVRTNFRMPDLTSLGLGGGSIVRRVGGRMAVGPQSVGFRLTEKALVFGGDTFTMTDVAVRRGMACLGDPALVRPLPAADVEEAFSTAIAMVEETIDRMKTSPEPVPLVAVGGGSILLPDAIRGASEVIHPPHFEVANAIGAAIAQVSGEIDRVWSLEGRQRADVLEEAKEAARQEAIKAGADPATIEIIEVDEIPLAYLPSNAVRLRCKAAGSLAE